MTAAKIAYWYFRLNGFLIIENFVVHPSSQEVRVQPGQKTEADLYGVRFPHRRELAMKDDDAFEGTRAKPLFVIAEITRGQCKLNGPWTNPERENMEYVLGALGAFPPDQQAEVARSLYKHCIYPYGEGKECEFRLIAVGKDLNAELQEKYPDLMQVGLVPMLKFMHKRFKAYWVQKADHSQWDDFGQRLWTEAERSRGDWQAFAEAIMKTV